MPGCQPDYVPPSDFLSLSTVSSASQRHGHSSPQPRPGFLFRSGASPSVQPPGLIDHALPPRRWTCLRSSLLRERSAPACRRPRGFAPHGDAFLGVRYSAFPFGRSPPRFCPPPGCLSPWARFPQSHPFMGFSGRTFGFPLVRSASLQRLSRRPPRFSRLRSNPPARGLWPSS